MNYFGIDNIGDKTKSECGFSRLYVSVKLKLFERWSVSPSLPYRRDSSVNRRNFDTSQIIGFQASFALHVARVFKKYQIMMNVSNTLNKTSSKPV